MKREKETDFGKNGGSSGASVLCPQSLLSLGCGGTGLEMESATFIAQQSVDCRVSIW